MRNIELLIKPVSYDCNLKCEYCFYKTTQSIYPDKKHLMDDSTLETLISKALSYSNGKTAVFSWQGGEPLLAGDNFFKKVVSFQKKHGLPGQRVGNSIQTNGLLLNEEYIELFKGYNFFIGLSIDGNEKIHNFYRGNSFAKTFEAAYVLRKAELEFNILTVINAFNVNKPEELYKFYLENNFNYIQIIPCVENDESGKIRLLSVTPASYGKFLCGFFDLWYNNENPRISVRFFDNILEILAGLAPSYCGFKDKCTDYLVVEHNGDVYPCDFFVKKEWKLGNIVSDSLEKLFKSANDTFSHLKSKVNKACTDCSWNFICQGGCLKYRLVNGNRYDNTDYLCESYKELFKYSLNKMKKLLAKYFRQETL